MFLIIFLIWCSNFEGCIGRRGKHWRENRDSLLKKKGKNYGNGHNNHNGGGLKPKAPPQKSIPPPQLQPPPPSQEGAPSTLPPPQNNNGGSSAIFNVLDFGAKGHGDTDDTKVNSTFNFIAHRNWF